MTVDGIRVLLVSDVRLFREGLTQLLRGHAAIEVVCAAATHDDLAAVAGDCRPDVILLDMGTDASPAVVHAARRAAPHALAIAFGVDENADAVLACAEEGMTAYVTRDASLDDLVSAIRSVRLGELHCPPGIAAAMFGRIATLAPRGRPRSPTCRSPLASWRWRTSSARGCRTRRSPPGSGSSTRR
jgi:DNA-binding NarL/FixJ family response regulator